ncbi:hypothetical protein DP117_26785 [Brasilonema sp. UFV-L1]|nr:hypothetical protein [Brasilonema sp. UFV-L1]
MENRHCRVFTLAKQASESYLSLCEKTGALRLGSSEAIASLLPKRKARVHECRQIASFVKWY